MGLPYTDTPDWVYSGPSLLGVWQQQQWLKQWGLFDFYDSPTLHSTMHAQLPSVWQPMFQFVTVKYVISAAVKVKWSVLHGTVSIIYKSQRSRNGYALVRVWAQAGAPFLSLRSIPMKNLTCQWCNCVCMYVCAYTVYQEVALSKYVLNEHMILNVQMRAAPCVKQLKWM